MSKISILTLLANIKNDVTCFRYWTIGLMFHFLPTGSWIQRWKYDIACLEFHFLPTDGWIKRSVSVCDGLSYFLHISSQKLNGRDKKIGSVSSVIFLFLFLLTQIKSLGSEVQNKVGRSAVLSFYSIFSATLKKV